jgi:murein L,D-transpeptidase YafK
MAVTTSAMAQPQPDPSVPQNVRIVEEHKDKNGNTIRTIQYTQNGNRFTETQIVKPSLGYHVPINPDTLLSDSVTVIVSKAKGCVDVYYRRHKIRSYKAVFGPKPLLDKSMEGDRCTPEGWYTIRLKKPSSRYYKFMLLDYPNDSSIARFNRLKANGQVPRNARIGGDVGIHGIWKGGDDMIEMGIGWTDGCIALTNKDIDDLYPLISVGTRIFIRK